MRACFKPRCYARPSSCLEHLKLLYASGRPVAGKVDKQWRLATQITESYSDKLQYVLDQIDALNSEDPRIVTADGIEYPYERLYSEWLTGWVKRLEPNPTEELLIVARGQHVQRWKTPRDSYPEGRQAYLQWRNDLKKTHAATVTSIMREAGYPDEAVNKVERIIMKKNIRDPENQTVEDALCLTFLQHQFAEFRLKEDEETMLRILRKTWGKMGDLGKTQALSLQLDKPEQDLLAKALGS